MAEQDKLERIADAIHKTGDDVEKSLVRDGYGPDYQNKPTDRDWRKGYLQGLRDTEKNLRE